MRNLHKWDLSYTQAIELQKSLAPQVRFTPLKKKPRLVAGLDYSVGKTYIIGMRAVPFFVLI